ncbi:glycosyltransferase family 2 protein [Vibrio sp. CyArs1]|uniref:glycosyltransferase family 2 protein n=1 Tax=Vibrio sp. CyArs1 TaxID=2682577 RepID=UPI001F06C23D|nr:glycosyltransferase family 2 protein [Vibrio sp. CyArs1]
MNSPKVSVIIVNYNGGEYVIKAIQSLSKLNVTYEVIVVDNNSSDNSCDKIKKYNVNLIKSESNIGFARANNLAAKQANGSLLLFLNNDAALVCNIESLIKYTEEENDRCLISCLMHGESGMVRPSFGKFPLQAKHIITPSKMYINKKSFSKLAVDWIEGSFILVSAKFWKELNGFCEEIFMYGEDILLCKKVHNIGGDVIVFGNTEYFHKGGFNSSKKGNIYLGLNTFINYECKGVKKFWLKGMIYFSLVIKMVYSIVKKDRVSLKSYVNAIRKIND